MSKRRGFGVCRHTRTITTITAGLARVVCEACGHVSVRYVENSVQVFPIVERRYVAPPTTAGPFGDLPQAGPRVRPGHRCMLCTQRAVFVIPDGVVCDEHAWQAAARIDWDDSEVWVPIRIDRSNA